MTFIIDTLLTARKIKKFNKVIKGENMWVFLIHKRLIEVKFANSLQIFINKPESLMKKCCVTQQFLSLVESAFNHYIFILKDKM